MAESSTLNERDRILTEWLGEAHRKEAELEADLGAHIALTRKQSYKKRLQKHLTETRDHKRRVASRIKALGASSPSVSVPGVPGAMGEVAGKAIAAVKGQVGTARAILTNEPETHLRNAQEELREEHVEIALYSRIEAFAAEVGDRETAQLARGIRRDEERMAKFLAAELPRLVKDVVRAEVPRDQRAAGTRRRTTASRRRTTTPRRRTRGSTGSRRTSTRAAAGARS